MKYIKEALNHLWPISYGQNYFNVSSNSFSKGKKFCIIIEKLYLNSANFQFIRFLLSAIYHNL